MQYDEWTYGKKTVCMQVLHSAACLLKLPHLVHAYKTNSFSTNLVKLFIMNLD